jgi:radical SAM superfamily enzyme YgiQ (UPF0313 family)
MILLINPKYDMGTSFGKPRRLKYAMPPLGLAYLVSILEKNNVSVEFIDDYVTNIGIRGILEKVEEQNPDVVGISCLTPSALEVYMIAKKIKEQSPDTIIVLGNVHASYFAETILKEKIADVIVHYEGEYTLLELVIAIEKNKEIERVRGISFLKGSNVIHTPPRPFIKDLDGLPFPAWHRFPIEFYRFPSFVTTERSTLPVLASRGCPFRCIHCSAVKTMGKRYRERHPVKIVDEMEHLIENFGVKQIVFLDATFALKKKHGMDICNEMISRKINKRITWVCETRPDVVDKELLQNMYKAGCRRICYGFESGTQCLLDTLKKGFTLEGARKTAKYTRRAGIDTIGSFIFGIPGETPGTMKQTIQFAKELDLDFVKFHILTPFPGTPFYENLVATETLDTDDWKKIGSFSPSLDDMVYVPDGVHKKELIKMQRRATIEFYLRPKILFSQIFKTRT